MKPAQQLAKRRRILVVDRDALAHEKLCRKRLLESYDVRWVSGGTAALFQVDLSQVDLLLIDLDVPAPDGWAILLQTTEVSPPLPVVGLTERLEAPPQAFARGLRAVAEKPLDDLALLRLIDELLQPESRRRAEFRFISRRTIKLQSGLPPSAIEPGRDLTAHSGWGINE